MLASQCASPPQLQRRSACPLGRSRQATGTSCRRRPTSRTTRRIGDRGTANSCSHDGCACTSAEGSKCECGEGHPHTKNASVGGVSRLSGRYGVDEDVWNCLREPTAEKQKLIKKKQGDSSAAGAASTLYGREKRGQIPLIATRGFHVPHRHLRQGDRPRR